MSWGNLGSKIPVQNPDLAWRIVDDECILVDPQGSAATVLNTVGARIWELADGKRTLAQILDQLIEEYNVEPARLASDADEFVRHLEKLKLISFEVAQR